MLRERVDQTRKGLTPAEVERLDDVLAPDAIEAAVPRLFIVSASLEGDLLNQWRGYAGIGGYAIALSRRSNYAPFPR